MSRDITGVLNFCPPWALRNGKRLITALHINSCALAVLANKQLHVPVCYPVSLYSLLIVSLFYCSSLHYNTFIIHYQFLITLIFTDSSGCPLPQPTTPCCAPGSPRAL